MSPRHVLLTTDVVGGVWDFSLVLARSLADSPGWRVTLLALGSPSTAQAEAAARCGAELLTARLKLEWMQDAAEDVARTRDLLATLVRDLHVDVLHANQFAAACAEVDVPVVLTLHSDVLSWRRWTLGESNPADNLSPEWTAYVRLVRQGLARATHVVAVSRFLAGQFHDLYAPRSAIHVIPNAWPDPADEAVGALGSARQPGTGADSGISTRPRVSLLAGRVWDAAKNISLAATAARLLNDPGRVLLAGEQRHPEGGLASVPPPLQPLGFLDRDDLERHMRQARVYLSPARYDPFGLLPLQAALHGCALLLSDIPSYREVWSDTATYFCPDDPAHLAQTWSALLDNPAHAAAQARRARTRAQERYSPTQMRAAYQSLYASPAPLPIGSLTTTGRARASAPASAVTNGVQRPTTAMAPSKTQGAAGCAPARRSGGAAPVYGLTDRPHVRP